MDEEGVRDDEDGKAGVPVVLPGEFFNWGMTV
jgi:hypothetical protein